jgi:hypothetical protein
MPLRLVPAILAATLALVLVPLAGPVLAADPAPDPTSGTIRFVPDVTAHEVLAGTRTRTLPTWQLDGGVLVVDRRPAGAGTLDGASAGTLDAAPGARELAPRHAGGEFFLVGSRPGARHTHADAELDAFGHVHLRAGEAAVVEVAPARLDAFLRANLCVQYLDRSRLAPAQVGGGSVPAHSGAGRVPAHGETEQDAGTPGGAGAALLTVDPAAKADYLDQIDQESFDRLIREISGDLPFWHQGGPTTVSTRYYSTADNDVVTDYLAQTLAGWGYTVELDAFTAWGQTCRNVVATLPGTTAPDEIVVVGGHFDSTSPDPGTLAPGAEDNASGTSLVMELARVSAGRSFERTVQFVLFDAEEIGLRGSQHFVDEAVAEGRTIVAALTADMVAYHATDYGVLIEGEQPWQWLMDAVAANVTGYTDIAYETSFFSWGSDHVPFQQAGIAALLAIDLDWDEYPHYHQTSDTWQQLATTSELGGQITRAVGGALADVAGLVGGATGVGDGVGDGPAGDLPGPTPALTAYPNPFNPSVTLRFELTAPATGELAVYDLAGRKVVTVASGIFLAGVQEVVWRGVDGAGRAVPSGTYLVRLRTADGSTGRTVQLVR